MDDGGRLAAVRKCQNYNRKFVHIMNDIIKNRQEVYHNCLSREQQEASTKLVSDVLTVKRSVVRNRVLLQCMQARKQSSQHDPTPQTYGVYRGRPLDAFSRDIDRVLAWNHPRLKRLRKVERAKQNCLKHGAILDQRAMKSKMEDFFSRYRQRAEAVAAYNRSLRRSSPQPDRKKKKRAGLGSLTDENSFVYHSLPDPKQIAQLRQQRDVSHNAKPDTSRGGLRPGHGYLASPDVRTSGQVLGKASGKPLPPIARTASSLGKEELPTQKASVPVSSPENSVSGTQNMKPKHAVKPVKSLEKSDHKGNRPIKDTDDEDDDIQSKAARRLSDRHDGLRQQMTSQRSPEHSADDAKLLPSLREDRVTSRSRRRKELEDLGAAILLSPDHEKPSGGEIPVVLSRAPTLVLPPIRPTKDLMKNMNAFSDATRK
ncbi:uncharacterized protein LOC106013814 [Aplysia californica]|uniref:Uncharacterized protein LOC106013814 n=1 Tax=Aplysia californica TaxID=6500 RepID=A0ABM1AE54_APLCA|nr:uncharacterized protein LOC106013814 [Aplysia californica]